VFPQPFRAAITLFTPIDAPPALRPAAPNLVSATVVGGKLPPRRRPLTLGARILRGFSLAHYGNFGGWGVKALWVILGLAPAVLFSTALVMWCNRVLAPAMRRLRQDPSGPRLRG
jgi:uncharacterized iron-regulated membrane protein